jgi:hypothetical protein
MFKDSNGQVFNSYGLFTKKQTKGWFGTTESDLTKKEQNNLLFVEDALIKYGVGKLADTVVVNDHGRNLTAPPETYTAVRTPVNK